MTPEEIKALIERTISGSVKYYWIYLVISFFVGIALTIGVEYFKQKGQNIATKQDISIITEKIEQVKAQIQNNQEIEKQKRELKFKSLLSSLTIIDAFFSHKYNANGKVFDKQNSSTEEVRTCHNNLILTCENTEIIDLFTKILLPPKDRSVNQDPIPLLNEYRNLVRKELGFGEPLKLDTVNSWFGTTVFNK